MVITNAIIARSVLYVLSVMNVNNVQYAATAKIVLTAPAATILRTRKIKSL